MIPRKDENKSGRQPTRLMTTILVVRALNGIRREAEADRRAPAPGY